MESQKPRRLTSTVLGLMLVFSVLTALNFTSMNVLAGGHGDHSWSGDTYIKENKTYPESGNDSATITLTYGDLIICDGYTLTFNDNVSFEMRNIIGSSGDYGIQINATAKFVVNSGLSNTTIKTHSSSESITYSFTNSGTIDFL